jgi:L-ribulose-5-phosphate 3-epimerase UlaE
MGYFLRRFVGGETDNLTREQMLEVAEQALKLQLDLARDVLQLADRSPLPDDHKEKDQRILRARETARILG